MKRDVASFGGTRFEMPPKTGCNWNDGTAEPEPSSGSKRTLVRISYIIPGNGALFRIENAPHCIKAFRLAVDTQHRARLVGAEYRAGRCDESHLAPVSVLS